MAENTIRIEGLTPAGGAMPISGTIGTTPSGTQNVAIMSSSLLSTTPGIPAGTNFYSTSLSDVLGVVAANNFLSVFNPVGSGKTITMYNFIVAPWATAATSVTASMNVFRTTAASGGTLVAAANINKFSTAQANSIAEVRTGNPTVTTSGLLLGGFPPAVTSSATGVGPQPVVQLPSGSLFLLAPGQGVVMSTALGSVAQLWNLGFIWTEA